MRCKCLCYIFKVISYPQITVNITDLVISDLTYCDAFTTFCTRALAVVVVGVVVATMVTVTMFMVYK